MANYDPRAMYKTKLRVQNRIYELTLPSHLFEDVRVRGELSSVIKALDPATATSTVIGSFLYPVEIMTVEPVRGPSEAGDAFERPQLMEIEVRFFY